MPSDTFHLLIVSRELFLVRCRWILTLRTTMNFRLREILLELFLSNDLKKDFPWLFQLKTESIARILIKIKFDAVHAIGDECFI